jgi:hypothetical protein
VLVEADETSITIGWAAVPGAIAYELQVLEQGDAGSEGGDGETWRSLTQSRKDCARESLGPLCAYKDPLVCIQRCSQAVHEKQHRYDFPLLAYLMAVKGNTVRKRNLSPGQSLTVRVRSRDAIDWGSFSPSATLQVSPCGH